MKSLTLVNSSPTLGDKRKRKRDNLIDDCVSIFNSDRVSIQLTAFTKSKKKSLKIFLEDLPEEIRKGIGDFATRLIAERLSER